MEEYGWRPRHTVIVILVFIALGIIGTIIWWANQAVDVAKDEFGPKAALQKYEWFINQANAINKADKDITLFEQRKADVDSQYNKNYGEDHTKWSASAIAQYNQATQTARDDLLAIVSNRNSLVQEYNAQSQKFNWAPFKTRSDLPKQQYDEYVVK